MFTSCYYCLGKIMKIPPGVLTGRKSLRFYASRLLPLTRMLEAPLNANNEK